MDPVNHPQFFQIHDENFEVLELESVMKIYQNILSSRDPYQAYLSQDTLEVGDSYIRNRNFDIILGMMQQKKFDDIKRFIEMHEVDFTFRRHNLTLIEHATDHCGTKQQFELIAMRSIKIISEVGRQLLVSAAQREKKELLEYMIYDLKINPNLIRNCVICDLFLNTLGASEELFNEFRE